MEEIFESCFRLPSCSHGAEGGPSLDIDFCKMEVEVIVAPESAMWWRLSTIKVQLELEFRCDASQTWFQYSPVYGIHGVQKIAKTGLETLSLCRL